jgi:hypothetical protein
VSVVFVLSRRPSLDARRWFARETRANSIGARDAKRRARDRSSGRDEIRLARLATRGKNERARS